MRGNRQKLKYGKFHFNLKKYFFYSEGGQNLDQAPQHSCGGSILGDPILDGWIR